MGGGPERDLLQWMHMVNKVAKVLVAVFLCLVAILSLVIHWMGTKMIIVPPQS